MSRRHTSMICFCGNDCCSMLYPHLFLWQYHLVSKPSVRRCIADLPTFFRSTWNRSVGAQSNQHSSIAQAACERKKWTSPTALLTLTVSSLYAHLSDETSHATIESPNGCFHETRHRLSLPSFVAARHLLPI